jgi:hypothetical protein
VAANLQYLPPLLNPWDCKTSPIELASDSGKLLIGYDFPRQYRNVKRSVRFFNGTLHIHHRQYHEDERLDDAYRETRSEVRKRLKTQPNLRLASRKPDPACKLPGQPSDSGPAERSTQSY